MPADRGRLTLDRVRVPEPAIAARSPRSCAGGCMRTGVVTLCVVEALLIGLLFVQLRKRRRAEDDWRASEERYREVVEAQTELVSRYERDGTLTFVNPAYCRYFGRPREQLIGRS